MSSDTDLMHHITVLLKRGIVLRASPYFSPCIISHIFMATVNNNLSPMTRGFLFLAIKYETSKEASSVFVKKIALVYSEEIHVSLSAYADFLH
jgi:hypothetical protein